jgi:hypothetical protein
MSVSSARSSAVLRFISDYGGTVFQKKERWGKKSQIGNPDGPRGDSFDTTLYRLWGAKVEEKRLGSGEVVGSNLEQKMKSSAKCV